jgi:uncharacterized protein with PQ loop repeat
VPTPTKESDEEDPAEGLPRHRLGSGCGWRNQAILLNNRFWRSRATIASRRFYNEEADMKIIRYFAVFLLLLTGVLHVLIAIKEPSAPTALPTGIFGVIYFALGLFLFFKKKLALIGSMLIPCIGLGAGLLVTGYSNWTPLFTFLYAIDAVVVASCAILFFRRSATGT